MPLDDKRLREIEELDVARERIRDLERELEDVKIGAIDSSLGLNAAMHEMGLIHALLEKFCPLFDVKYADFETPSDCLEFILGEEPRDKDTAWWKARLTEACRVACDNRDAYAAELKRVRGEYDRLSALSASLHAPEGR